MNAGATSSRGSDLTPLHIAIKFGHMGIAAYLFSKGARSMCNKRHCHKCRLQTTMMARRVKRMSAEIAKRIALEALAADRKREVEEVMRELSYTDFQQEMRKIMKDG